MEIERSPQESSVKRQRFVKLVHREPISRKEKFGWLLERNWGRIFMGARRGKSYM